MDPVRDAMQPMVTNPLRRPVVNDVFYVGAHVKMEGMWFEVRKATKKDLVLRAVATPQQIASSISVKRVEPELAGLEGGSENGKAEGP